MDINRRLLVHHTFGGPRFERGGLDLSVLPELIAYRELVVECAKELWRRANPDRERLPANFDDRVSLSMSGIESGSVVVPIERVTVHGEQANFLDEPDEVDRAVNLITEVIVAASNDSPVPPEFPKSVLTRFEEYGKTLRDDEWTELRPAGRKHSAKYTQATRRVLTQWTAQRYEDQIDLIGAVTMTRLMPPRFEIQVGDDGRRVEAPFEPAAEEAILQGLAAHDTGKVRVQGIGEFAGAQLHRITRVDDVQFLPGGELPVDTSRPGIWERVREIMADVPEEELENIPHSDELDDVLYRQQGG